MTASRSNRYGNTTLQHPEQWKTGDQPATTAQRSYLETLEREANVEVDPDRPMTKCEASVEIDELQKQTGRD